MLQHQLALTDVGYTWEARYVLIPILFYFPRGREVLPSHPAYLRLATFVQRVPVSSLLPTGFGHMLRGRVSREDSGIRRGRLSDVDINKI